MISSLASYILSNKTLDDSSFSALLCRVPPEKRTSILAFQGQHERQLRLLAALLVRIYACNLLGRPNSALRFAVGPHGKPYLTDAPTFHYSLSHTRGALLVAVHNREIGVDIERYRTLREKVVRRFFSPTEQAYIFEDDEEQDLRTLELWTRKESYAKLLGIGLPSAFAEADTLRPGFPAHFYTKRLQNHVLTVCAREQEVCDISIQALALEEAVERMLLLSPIEDAERGPAL